FAMVLSARCALKPRTRVYSPGPRFLNGYGHVGFVQSACDDDSFIKSARELPIECLAGASIQARRDGIEEKCFRLWAFTENTWIELLATRQCFPHRQTGKDRSPV